MLRDLSHGGSDQSPVFWNRAEEVDACGLQLRNHLGLQRVPPVPWQVVDYHSGEPISELSGCAGGIVIELRDQDDSGVELLR